MFKQTSGLHKQTSGMFKQTSGMFKQTSGMFKQTSGLFKQTSGVSKKILGCSKIHLGFISFLRTLVGRHLYQYNENHFLLIMLLIPANTRFSNFKFTM